MTENKTCVYFLLIGQHRKRCHKTLFEKLGKWRVFKTGKTLRKMGFLQINLNICFDFGYWGKSFEMYSMLQKSVSSVQSKKVVEWRDIFATYCLVYCTHLRDTIDYLSV